MSRGQVAVSVGGLESGQVTVLCLSISPSVKWVRVTVVPPSLCCVRIKCNPACESIELVSSILG